MSLTTATGGPILTPDQVNALVVLPLTQSSVALQVSNVVQIDSHNLRIPIVTDDVAAAWTAELAEIAVDDVELSSITVTPKKLAALSLISAELAEDSSPSAQAETGRSIVRNLQKKLDSAFFGATVTDGPSGLKSLTVNQIDAGDSWADTDWAEKARTNAEQKGTQVTAFCASPNTVLALSTIKEFAAVGSNKHLLGVDPTQPSQRLVAGIPLIPSAAIADADGVWAIARDRSVVAMRRNVSLVTDGSAAFTKDGLYIRATVRVGYGFPQPLAFSQIKITP